ncbi:hypothetical protein FRC03_006487 [Tulasnella sp. 419]|nr:hypothetical protein FRC03_006487 [Tulasnella sp. 419]
MLNSSWFFIETLHRLFILPTFLAGTIAVGLYITKGLRLPTTRLILLYLIFLPAYWTLTVQLHRWRTSRNAKRLGVKLPHTISGKRLGNLDLLRRLLGGLLRGYIGDIVDTVLDEEGVNTIKVSLLWSDVIFTRDPEVIKFVLSTGFDNFGKGPRAKVLGEGFLEPGIFAVDNPLAKYHRGILRPYFARERITDFKHFLQYTDKMLRILCNVADADEPCDIQEVFERFTLDAAGAFLFGSPDLNTLNLPLTRAGEPGASMGLYTGFVKGFEEAKNVLEMRRTSNIYAWTATQFFHNPMDEPAKLVSDYAEPLIKRAMEKRRVKEGDTDADEPECFIDHLILSMGHDTAGIKTQLVNVMLAARDTTAVLLAFIVYLLSVHPEVMEKLRSEILGAYSLEGIPTFEDMKGLKYLRAVINEALRLFPPVSKYYLHLLIA